MAEFSENRHISNLINMSCKVVVQNINPNVIIQVQRLFSDCYKILSNCHEVSIKNV